MSSDEDRFWDAWQDYLTCEHEWAKVDAEDMPPGFGAVFRCTKCECLRMDRVRH